MQLTETIDQHKLNYILENFDEFKPQLRKVSFKRVYEPLKICRSYLNKSKGGQVSVTYNQHDKQGRMHANKGLSLQIIPREIRHTIARDNYVDIDMVNSGPNILSNLCKKYGFDCDYIDDYIEDRQKHINDLGLSKSEGKMLFIMIIFGNESDYKKLQNKTKFLKRFKREVSNIEDEFAKKFPKELKKIIKKRDKADKSYNYEGSLMNHLICVEENNILMAIHEFYDSPEDCSLQFDGLMIRKRDDGDYKLRECEAYVEEKLGFKIQLIEKPMDQGFDIPDDIEPYVDVDIFDGNIISKMLYEYVVNQNFNDNTLSSLYCEEYKHDIVTIDEAGNGYIWSESKKLWTKSTPTDLMSRVRSSDGQIMKAFDDVQRIITGKYNDLPNPKDSKDPNKKKIDSIMKYFKKCKERVQTVRCAKDAFSFSKISLMDIDFEDSLNMNHSLFPCVGGIIDLKTSESRERTKEDKFSFECPVNYIDPLEWTKEDKELQHEFVEKIFMEDKEYIEYRRVKCGAYLCGNSEQREIDIFHGTGRNGKTTFTNALQLILGNFAGKLNKDTIVIDPKSHKSHNPSGHSAHLAVLIGKRFIIVDEIDEQDVINGAAFKPIVSNDPINIRRLHQEEKTYNIFCDIGLNSNHVPKYNKNDQAITDRMCICPHKARFLNKRDMDNEKSTGLYDPKKYKYYDADSKVIEQYKQVGRPIDILFSWMVGGCATFYEAKQDGIKKPKIVSDYMTTKLNESDVVGQWINAKCNVVNPEEFNKMKKNEASHNRTLVSILYENFSDWALKNDCHSGLGKKQFREGMDMRFKKKKMESGIKYERITLKIEEDFGSDDDDDLD